MASNEDFVQFIVDQCSGAGEITVKKMMWMLVLPKPKAKRNPMLEK